MIQMPRRSVTRYLIPLIDVLLLTFAIFLLLPIFRESEPDNPDKAKAANDKKLRDLEKDVERLKDELKRLRKLQATPLTQRLAIRVLEVDPNDGRLFYYAPGPPQKKTYLESPEAAQALILHHRREVLDRHKGDAVLPELHYLFVFPRENTAFPNGLQVKRYDRWFADVSHSIDRPGARP